MATRSERPAPLRAPLILLTLALLAAPSAARATPCCPGSMFGLVLELSDPLALRSEYRAGALLIRDDSTGTMRSTLIELARRRSGRDMLQRLARSPFITVLVSQNLRSMQAGLWGPIFSRGRVVGACLYVDLVKIRGFDHDPTGVETLAHELRHQIDASRAFSKSGTYRAVYLAAYRGDQTRSAERYAARVRDQRPDMSTHQATRWLTPFLSRLEPADGVLVAQRTSPAVAER